MSHVSLDLWSTCSTISLSVWPYVRGLHHGVHESWQSETQGLPGSLEVCYSASLGQVVSREYWLVAVISWLIALVGCTMEQGECK